MPVKTYSVQQSGSTLLAPNFKVCEFACKDGSDTVLVDLDLATILQKIRDHFKTPVSINSAYRTASHNKAIGGALKSKHLEGKAADIVVGSVDPLRVCQYAESIGVKGIGRYNAFTHVDTRTSKYLWDCRSGAEKAVSSFGGTTPSTATEPTQAYNGIILRINAKKAIVNGKVGPIDTNGSYPYILNGKTMVPLRFTSEKMGATVKWTANNKPVTVKYSSTTVELTVGSKTISVTKNGKASNISVDQVPVLKNGRIYVPLRVVAENLGFSVKYDDATMVIVITKGKLSMEDLAAMMKEGAGKLK